MLTVKNNQPKLFDALEERFLFAKESEIRSDVTYDCGHGRDEKRTIETISIKDKDKINGRFKGIHQIIRITRWQKSHTTYETKDHVVYAICSRGHKKLNVSALAQAIRGHWSIEVRLHGQRDVRMQEDANKTRTAAAPRALACLRNWAIAIVETFQRSKAITKICNSWNYLRFHQGEFIETILT